MVDANNLKLKKSEKTYLTLNADMETYVLIHNGFCEIKSSKINLSNISNSLLYFPASIGETVILEGMAEVCSISFKKQFFPHFFFELSVYFKRLDVLNFNGLSCFENLLNLCRMIEFELKAEIININIVKTLIHSFFSIYFSEFKKQSAKNFPSETTIYIDKLLGLVEENFRKNHPLAFYAESLNLTERQLNNLSNTYFSKTVNNLIIARKMVEAQNELIKSEKNIAEIGYNLGYNEKSYFSRTFKKNIGVTPSEYQSLYRQMEK